MIHHLFDSKEKNEDPQDHYQVMVRLILCGLAIFFVSVIWHAGAKVVGA